MKFIVNALGHILLSLSYLTPRNPNKWVVGNSSGFSDNSKYLYLYTQRVLNKEDIYWICRKRRVVKDVRAAGLKAYHTWSPKGMYHLLTAGAYIYHFRASGLNIWTRGRAKQIQLWHGVGIKNIEFKGSVAAFKQNSFWSYMCHPSKYIKPDLFLSTSPLMTKHFCECFRITPDRCIESSYPRCDIFQLSKEELLNQIDTYEPKVTRQLVDKLMTANRSYIYMPTWRDTQLDIFTESKFDFKALNKVLHEKNEYFVLKLHPFTKSFIDFGKFDRIILMDKSMDIYPVLPFTDVLITDYSSIYFDYLLMKDKNILLFPYDYERFITNDRDLAFDYNDYMPAVKANTFNELLTIISENRSLVDDRQNWARKTFWESDNYIDLYDAIMKVTHLG